LPGQRDQTRTRQFRLKAKGNYMTHRTIHEACLNLNQPLSLESLSRRERRLLLRANLQLLLQRFACGQQVFQSDLIRAASLADDAGCPEGTRDACSND
jgi:hypothetical protein